MTLYIDSHGSSAGTLTGVLSLQILAHGLGQFNGSNDTIQDIPFYKLEYLFDPADHVNPPFTCLALKALSDAPGEAIVSLQNSTFTPPVTGARPLNEAGGGATVDVGATGGIVFWDYTNCDGKGRWTKGLDGKNIPCSNESVLLHELMHCVYRIIGGHPSVASNGVEPFAVTETNKHRAEMGEPLRITTGSPVGCGPPPPNSFLDWINSMRPSFEGLGSVFGFGR